MLATLARQAEGEGVDSLIVTGDRDILQVVNEHIRVLTSGRQFSDTIIYDPPAVEEKYSLRTNQLVDYKALVGDKSDNIPGVRGIGEKGAVALLQKYWHVRGGLRALGRGDAGAHQEGADGGRGGRLAEPDVGAHHFGCAHSA